MGNRYKYRFRTKDEFLKKFGSEWRKVVQYTWNNHYMDRFFGKDLSDYMSDEDIISYEKIGKVGFFSESMRFRISTDMVIRECLRPSYKPKKILRKI